jgi:uncharacterized LabA/DUF88 family protein
MSGAFEQESIAVFVDAENLINSAEKLGIPVVLKPIMDRIREEGQVVFTKAYADWAQDWISNHLSEFRENTFEMTEVSTTAYGKNTADMQMAVDALEMALLPSSPTTFVIVSGDRDFVPLVQKIKRYGKRVIGIGVSEDSTSRLLIQACHTFLFASDLMPGGTPETQIADMAASLHAPAVQSGQDSATAPTSHQREALSLLARAVAACVRQGQPPTEDSIKQRMLQLKSTFYVSRYGYRTFLEMAEHAEQLGYAKVKEVTVDGEVVFDPTFSPDPSLLKEEHTLDEGDYENPYAAAAAYRRILKTRKFLDILPYSDRLRLVRAAWRLFEEDTSSGKTYDEIVSHLVEDSDRAGRRLAPKAVELVVRTLSIAKCFASDSGEPPHFEKRQCKVYPAVSVD